MVFIGFLFKYKNMAEVKKSEGIDIDNLINGDEKRVLEIFDHNYQNCFLKTLLNNENFFLEVFDIIVPQYFDDYQRIIIDKVIKYYNKNSVCPDFDDLKRQIKIDEKDLQKDHLIGLIDKISEVKIKSDKPIIDTAMLFFKKRAMADALYKMATMWSKDDFESMTQPLNNALKAGQKKEGGLDYAKDVKKTLGEETKGSIDFMEGVDCELNGNQLSNGTLTVILAPTGGGKSMVLVSSATYTINKAIEKRKKRSVLYISLELNEKYIAKRFHSAFTGIPLSEQKFFPDVIEESVERIFGDGLCKLEIQQFPTRRLTVAGLAVFLDGLKRNKNFVPDIIYLDYADIMNSSSYDKDLRLALQILYQELRGLAITIDLPIISASQTNRSSANLKYISIESVAESYAKLSEADLILSVASGNSGEVDENNKPITLKSLKKATIGFLKNRMGADGFYKDMDFDTSRVQIRVLEDEKDKGFKKESEKNSQEFSLKTSPKQAEQSINAILEKQSRENNGIK